MKLYVGNLSFNTTNQDLNELFGTVGTVQSSNIIEDRETGRSRGFGFVEMSSQAEGQEAIAQLDVETRLECRIKKIGRFRKSRPEIAEIELYDSRHDGMLCGP